MKTRGLPFSGQKPSRWVSAALATATAITVAGMGASPAQSAASNDCPAAFPKASLTKDQPVHGLTVVSGTTPEQFTGRVLGILENGVMPGLDMIMVDLSSPAVEEMGIWFGMSGSPVYASDGRLIGAVAYGLSYGASTIAGLTPAADMQQLLDPGNNPNTLAKPRTNVEIPDRMAARIVASGEATAEQVESGMTQLKLPVGIAGLGSQRFDQVAKQLDIPNARLMRVGTTSSATSAASPLMAGGNLAASFAYGDITAAATGTTTMVCGDEVIGFGHPFMWSGPASLTMHGADALVVHDDPPWAGFKLANIGDPIGTVNQDRRAGIVGTPGAVPPTSDVTSSVSSGTRARDGETFVSRPDYVPDIAFSHLLANEDLIFDGYGKGSGTLSWTVNGTREDGSPFSLTRQEIQADAYDLTWASSWEMYMTLAQIQYNGIEDVTIDSVDADATLSRDYDHYILEKVSYRRSGEWVNVSETRNVKLRAGRTAFFKAQLRAPDAGLRTVILEVPIGKRLLGSFGSLSVFGGNSGGFSEEEYYYEGDGGGSSGTMPTFDEILADLAKAPHNDEVVVDLTFYTESGDIAKQKQRRSATGLVVDGYVNTGVRIIR